MAPGHDQDDREKTRDREGVATEPGTSGPTITRGGRRVEVLRDAIGVDDGDEPVDEDAEVDDEDRIEDGRVDQETEQRDLVHADDGAGREGQRQDRPGGEGQRPHRRTGIQLAESGEDQREESGRKRGPRARSRALWFVHRG